MVLDFFIVDVSALHSDTPKSVGLLWTSEPSVPETFICTTPNNQKRQQSMPQVGFEPTIQASGRPQIPRLPPRGDCYQEFLFIVKCKIGKGKGKAIPLQAWTGLEGSRTLRLPDFKTIGTLRW